MLMGLLIFKLFFYYKFIMAKEKKSFFERLTGSIRADDDSEEIDKILLNYLLIILSIKSHK